MEKEDLELMDLYEQYMDPETIAKIVEDDLQDEERHTSRDHQYTESKFDDSISFFSSFPL